MLSKIRNSFFTGLAIVVPLAVTWFLLKFLINSLNSILLQPAMNFLNLYFQTEHSTYIVKALIFLTVVAGITLIGFGARIFLIRKVFILGEKLFYKVPLVNKIYEATKQISSAFIGRRRGLFLRAVLIEYPRKGAYTIGFVTAHGRGKTQARVGKKLLNIFVPTTPNPTSGYLLLIPEEDAKPLDVSVEEAMKMIVSGGAVPV